MENKIKAEIITHSKRESTGEEIITYKLTYPRIIHSELMTYHMMSVNSASSRAIPVDKLIKVIEENPFYPMAYQRKHSGMQGNQYFTSQEDINKCNELWKESMEESIRVAKKMLEAGISKQIINRTLESYQYHCCLITGTRESFEHLFEQRCPQYEFEDGEMRLINGTIIPGILKGKSKKEVLVTATLNSGSPRIIEDGLSELEWLQHNKGQAEIHFMDLAEKMYDALHESQPQILKEGQWHIPFDSEITQQLGTLDIPLMDMIKMSVAKTARISYTTIDGTKDLTLEQASSIFEKCKQNGHYSVFSHITKCMTDYEYNSWIKGQCKPVGFSEFEEETFWEAPDFTKGFNKNLRGFISYRQNIENELNHNEIQGAL